MNIGEWIEELMEQVKAEIEKNGLEGNAELQMVKKANDRELHVITIRSNTGISPVMYINKLWDLHLKGEDTKTLAEYVVCGYKGHCKKKEQFSDVLDDKEELMKHLYVKLVDSKYNEQYLNHCVHKEVEAGLALIAEARFDDKENFGFYSSVITQDLADTQNLDKEEVVAAGVENARNDEDGVKLFVLSKNIFNDKPDNVLGQELDKNEVFVLTTESQMCGTHIIVTRPDVMNDIRDQIGDFWIIPSSRHEVLVIAKEQERLTPKQMLEMLRDANKEVVSDDDFFSDDLFQYTEHGLERYEI